MKVVLFTARQAITVKVNITVNKVLKALDSIVKDIINAAVNIIKALAIVIKVGK